MTAEVTSGVAETSPTDDGAAQAGAAGRMNWLRARVPGAGDGIA
jgi:hypothetical protein